MIWRNLGWLLVSVALFLFGVYVTLHFGPIADDFVTGWCLVGGLGMVGYNSWTIFKALRHRDHFYKAFGNMPPSSPKDWKVFRVLAPKVLADLKRYAEAFQNACTTEEACLRSAPTDQAQLKERISQLKAATRELKRSKRNLRRAQNSAQFYGYSVPNNADEILKLKELITI